MTNLLTDGEMVVLLHNMARTFEQNGSKEQGSELRQTADRFSELSKAASIAYHKAKQG